MQLVIGIVIGIVLLALGQFLVLPWYRIELRRKSSRTHAPQPEELWMQDEQLLYITAIGPTGVEIMQYDPVTKQMNKWKDTWPDWQARLHTRVLWFTGERRPLGNA